MQFEKYDQNYICYKHKMGRVTKLVAVLLPGFAVNWWQNQVTRQPQFRDLTQMTMNYKLIA